MLARAENRFVESPRIRGCRWAAATLCVFALYAGAGAALLYRVDELDVDAGGSVAIELAPIAAGFTVDTADLAPGPLQQETPPAQKATKRPDPVVDAMLTAPPSPLAPSPEVLAPQEKEKPKPQTKAESTQEEQPSEAVPVTTAPPQLDAPLALVPAAPVAGVSTLAAKAQATWYSELISRINRTKHYPKGAHAQHLEGVVKLQFTVDRAGRIVAASVTQSSGSLLLDAEAMAMLHRATPLPLPPDQAAGETFEFVLPIHFALR